MLNLEQCKEICARAFPTGHHGQARFDAEQWLIQEVERLLNGAEPDEGFNMASDYFSKGHTKVITENEALRQQLAEAQKDAERYRWLRNKAFTEDSDGGYVKYYVLPKVCYANAADYIGHKPYYYKSLDGAIDAAIGENK